MHSKLTKKMKLKINKTYFRKLILQQPRSLGAFLYDVSGPVEGKIKSQLEAIKPCNRSCKYFFQGNRKGNAPLSYLAKTLFIFGANFSL